MRSGSTVSDFNSGFKMADHAVEFTDLSPLRGEESEISLAMDSKEIHGLGIVPKYTPTIINRVPVGSRSHQPRRDTESVGSSLTGTPQTSESSKALLSPWGTAHEGGHRKQQDSESYQGNGNLQSSSSNNSFSESTLPEEDTAFQDQTAPSSSVGVDLKQDGCASVHEVHQDHKSWLAISMMILAAYSTIMSGIWLIVALVQPRWGRAIYSGGSFTPSTASLLSALLAKTIELSFVTVFVGFIGQVLSRRSLVTNSRGVTLAEMSMRTWIIQPGSLFTNGHTLRYAGLTFLGVVSLVVTLVAMLYTTASDALVSPKLMFGHWESKLMHGLVQSSYANPYFVNTTCPTPISPAEDADAGTTCLAIEHAGQAYHNYATWMSTWTQIGHSSTGASKRLIDRPQAVAMLFGNTTVSGNWIQESNMSDDYERYKRVVNNVTMAMPHAGVFAAAREEGNEILQPAELEGTGEYHIKASVVSPSINVLCVNMNATELAPLVYVKWPNAKKNESDIPGQELPWPGWFSEVPTTGNSPTYGNATVVDDIFQWGKKYERRPPAFPMLPLDYNSIADFRILQGDSIYLLLKSSKLKDYTVCSLRSFQSSSCSTRYNVTGSTTGALEAYCEDPNDEWTYQRSVPGFVQSFSRDWPNIASEWVFALALDDGRLNANSSNARLLSHLVLDSPTLPTVRPSIAEALAVLSGCTLLLGSTSGPFVHYWEYNQTILNPGKYQLFNASIQSQQYTSGTSQRWQGVFYLVLVLVFATNVFCLGYFIVRKGLMTDFIEPQNLFALAVNSPPSTRLAGSCGSGPEGKMLDVDWHIQMEEGSKHYYIHEGEQRDKPERNSGYMSVYSTPSFHGDKKSRATSWYSVLTTKRRSFV